MILGRILRYVRRLGGGFTLFKVLDE